MNILVCIKQVPDDSVEVSMGADGKPAVEGLTPVVNAFDTYALEMATRYKEALADDTQITVICVGPESAKNSLKNCLAVGADAAYLISDVPTDSLGIAEVLKGAVAKLEEEKGKFDLIFTGKEATDIAFGATGIMLASKLGYPVVTDAIDLEAVEGAVQVKHETDEGYRLIEAPLPAVITVSKPAYDPRYPTIKNKMAARRKKIDDLDGASLADATAPKTVVVAEIEPPKRAAGVKIQEESEEESTAKAIQMMVDAKVL